MGDQPETPETNQAPTMEHPAIWLMRRIGRFVKWTALILVGLVVVAVGGFWAYNYWTEALPRSQVQIDVFSDWQDKCTDPGFPLFVRILNNSRRTVEEVTFSIVAKRPGYSTNVVDYSNRDYSTDKILKPDEGFGQCWPVPLLSDKSMDWRHLEWSIGHAYVSFE